MHWLLRHLGCGVLWTTVVVWRRSHDGLIASHLQIAIGVMVWHLVICALGHARVAMASVIVVMISVVAMTPVAAMISVVAMIPC